MTDVQGGLDEPEALQPDPGALALVSAADDWSRADWEGAAAKVLRKTRRLGEDSPDDAVWAALTRTTYDDIAIPPLGTRADLDDLVTRGRPTRHGPWDVRTRTSGDSGAAVADLENGATSLWLVADEVAPDELPAALTGVRLDLAAVVLEGPTRAHAEALVALGPLHPDSNLGAAPDADPVDLEVFARLAQEAGVRAVVVDGTTVHEQGASDGQELGWVLARGAHVLRVLDAAGVPPEDAFGLVEVRVAATDEQFTTMAKFRALRRLWARLAELCQVADPRTRIHAVTSRSMTSAYDVHVNLLRGTVAAFGAGVGGADSITVVPFDEPTGEVSVLGRRMARNTSALLVAESHVAAVADPAGGAYAVERLTDDLARVAWAELGRIESDGLGAFEGRVRDVRARREVDVATRRRPLTGLSEFPRLGDPAPARRNLTYRWGAAFEALRAQPPTTHAFLATLGPVAAHTARAGFATNLFAAGGVAVDVAGPTAGVDDLVAAYDGQPVVCLAGTDAAYAEWGEAAASALRGAGARHVVVAGKPADWADDSCALGVDAVDFLTRTRGHLA
ncbi:methylmalonyl-CoA mutase family protein [Nocardioides cynanchi]|uniref:methylmalonyl-CoA mutase family protein n=1 Tax=Nocardioides cynanchi TaxID=2558918 RepID=UPI001248CC83|nr:methylmalonyl-CoA mutase family protein [Nocardioides cynanchi]